MTHLSNIATWCRYTYDCLDTSIMDAGPTCWWICVCIEEQPVFDNSINAQTKTAFVYNSLHHANSICVSHVLFKSRQSHLPSCSKWKRKVGSSQFKDGHLLNVARSTLGFYFWERAAWCKKWHAISGQCKKNIQMFGCLQDSQLSREWLAKHCDNHSCTNVAHSSLNKGATNSVNVPETRWMLPHTKLTQYLALID